MADLVAVRSVVLEANLAAHGLTATSVTTPENDYEDVRFLWLTFENESMPSGGGFSKREPIRVMVFRRADVPEIPKGTRIEAPERYGEGDSTWVVDGRERSESDHHRVVVRREVAACDAEE